VLLGSSGDQVSFNTTAGGCLVNLMIKAFFSSFHFSVRAKSLAFFAFTNLLIKNSNLMAEQRRNQAPLFDREHLLSKRLSRIVRTFE
jgi:hypothetical protein